LVIDRVGIVGAQDFAGGLRQVELRPAALHRHQLCEGVRVVDQGAVKRFVGNALCHQPGQRQAHRPEQQQRGEHPVQDLAEQGALLALEEFQGGGPGFESNWLVSNEIKRH
jgi:hypothetical protein